MNKLSYLNILKKFNILNKNLIKLSQTRDFNIFLNNNKLFINGINNLK